MPLKLSVECRHDFYFIRISTSHTKIFFKDGKIAMRDWHFERTSRIAATEQARQLAIIEATTDLVATIDIDGFLISLNDAGYELLELDGATNIRQLRWAGFYTKECAADFIENQMPNAFKFGSCNSEIDLVTVDGTVIPGSQVLITHKDGAGNIEHFSVILRNISSIKEAENERQALMEQLYQSKKVETIGRLAGGIAHDFNNLMAVIMGHAEIGLLNVASEEATKAELEIILDFTQKAARLSSQLLDISSNQIIKPQVLNLNEILHSSQQLIESLMGDEITIDFSTDYALWPIKIDRSQLEQIILNLSVNARDALERRGTYTLKTENLILTAKEANKIGLPDGGDFVRLVISDDGCGIAKGVIENIFDPFFTTKEKGKGTGLGLSAVYGAVKQNHGHIRVLSAVGVGTSFEVYFPRDGSNSQILKINAEKNKLPELTPGSEAILLVEDNEAVRHLLATILKNLGYSVLEAANGVEALELFNASEGNIDLVVSDVVMPKMNGMELYRELQKIDISTKVLLMSGHTDQLISLEELGGSNASFLSKPFPVQRFSDVVRDVLDREQQGSLVTN